MAELKNEGGSYLAGSAMFVPGTGHTFIRASSPIHLLVLVRKMQPPKIGHDLASSASTSPQRNSIALLAPRFRSPARQSPLFGPAMPRNRSMGRAPPSRPTVVAPKPAPPQQQQRSAATMAAPPVAAAPPAAAAPAGPGLFGQMASTAA